MDGNSSYRINSQLPHLFPVLCSFLFQSWIWLQAEYFQTSPSSSCTRIYFIYPQSNLNFNKTFIATIKLYRNLERKMPCNFKFYISIGVRLTFNLNNSRGKSRSDDNDAKFLLKYLRSPEEFEIWFLSQGKPV